MKKMEVFTSQKEIYKAMIFLENRIDYEIKKIVEYYIDRTRMC